MCILKKKYKKVAFQRLILSVKMSAHVPEVIAIIYQFYPGNSARWFPDIKSVILVKYDLYMKWKDNNESVKFEDILVDPSQPVKFMWTDWSRKKGLVEASEVMGSIKQWYFTYDMMEIAKKTAEKGLYDCNEEAKQCGLL